MDNTETRANNIILEAERVMDGKHNHTIKQQICLIKSALRLYKRGKFTEQKAKKSINMYIDNLIKVIR